MQKLFLFLGLFCMVACTKSTNDYSNSVPAKSQFFKNGEEAFDLVKKLVKRFHSDDNLNTIDRISYLFSAKRSYAFVFYTSCKGASNMVIQKDYVDNVAGGYTVTKCNGDNCNCYVNAVISNDGNISVSCSCSSCTMTINQGLQ